MCLSTWILEWSIYFTSHCGCFVCTENGSLVPQHRLFIPSSLNCIVRGTLICRFSLVYEYFRCAMAKIHPVQLNKTFLKFTLTKTVLLSDGNYPSKMVNVCRIVQFPIWPTFVRSKCWEYLWDQKQNQCPQEADLCLQNSVPESGRGCPKGTSNSRVKTVFAQY